MIIIGIDPGVATTGYGIIETTGNKNKSRQPPPKHSDDMSEATGQAVASRQLKCLDFGCVETDKNLYFPKRLLLLSKEIRKLVKICRPEMVAIESLFFFRNQKTVIKVSQAIGVLVYTIHQAGIPIVEYTPQQVKKSLTENGWAKKPEVQDKVRKILKIKEEIRPDDAADALAIAIHAARKF